MTGLIVLALALSSYLGWHYLVGGSVIGCDGGSPCDQVLGSRWSSIGGVLPVSGLAAGAYLAMLVASLSIGPATAAPVRQLAWRALLILVGAIAGSAVWFFIVQRWIVGAFCVYCMATHLTGLTLAALVIWRAPRQVDGDTTDPAPRIVGPWPAAGFAFVGVALAAVMATAQVAFPSRVESRRGELKEEVLSLDPHAVPLVGSPDARYVVALLFDYQCPHCQQMHFLLEEAIRRYHGQLAFALYPAPLSRQCNPYIERDAEAFQDSCELAKLALAVWVAKRDAFPEFERWMFSHESGDFWRPRRLDAVNAKAVELVGRAKFDTARTDPWIERYLQASIRIYGNTIEGGNAVPKLVFGSHWITPAPRDAGDLITILQDSLMVPKP